MSARSSQRSSLSRVATYERVSVLPSHSVRARASRSRSSSLARNTGRVDVELREAVADAGNATDEVIGTDHEVALELAEAEHRECPVALAERRAVGATERADVDRDPAAGPGPHARLHGAPRAHLGGEAGALRADPVAAAFGRLDEPRGGEPGQRNAHAVLADPEQRATRHGPARRQRLVVGAEHQLEDEVAGLSRHDLIEITRSCIKCNRV